MNIRHEFRDQVSSGSFEVIDDELRLIGKYGQVVLNGDVYDIWFIKPKLESISTRKLGYILRNLPKELCLTRLNGEAYAITKDKGVVLKTLSLLGVRVKRKLSREAIIQLIERLQGDV